MQAALRRTPEVRDRPAVLLGGKNGSSRVTDVNQSAWRAGIRGGMSRAQASAACAELRFLSALPADVEAAQAALADVGFGFAARVESEAETVFFAVDDLGQLYPDEQAVLQAAQAQAARVGLEVRVAIAGSKGVARLATRARALAVVPRGAAQTRAFLAALPVHLFTEDAELRETLGRWGISKAGDLAKLSPADVSLRLGEAGACACRLARGEDDEPFVPRFPTDALEEALDLDWAIAELEPLTFVLRGLIDRILQRLACRSLACAGLTMRLALEPRGLDVRTVPVAAPTRETTTLLELVRLDLARKPPAAPIVGVRLLALPARVRATQLDLLRPAGPAPDRLAATLARLAALVGPENVGAPATVDTWREEAVAVQPFALSTSGRAQVACRPEPPLLAIRRVRPPEEIEVLMGHNEPTALRGKQTMARVLVAAGPYRLSGEWWSDGGFAREYWNVHASDGAVYRIHRDCRDGRWFLDGYFD